jgi:hypothetical protein
MICQFGLLLFCLFFFSHCGAQQEQQKVIGGPEPDQRLPYKQYVSEQNYVRLLLWNLFYLFGLFPHASMCPSKLASANPSRNTRQCMPLAAQNQTRRGWLMEGAEMCAIQGQVSIQGGLQLPQGRQRG